MVYGRKGGGYSSVQEQVDALERRLNVRRRARRDGQQDIPDSFCQEPPEAEADIAAAVQAEREQLQLDEDSALQGLERELRRVAPVSVNFEAVFLEAEAALRQVESRLGRPFLDLRKAELRVQEQLADFRDANGLQRPPVYPESVTLQAALLAMAATFEAMFSATLFANASEAGLLGGATVALGLSGANVTLGFLAGFLGLRYLQHRRPALKLAGAACVIAAIAAAGSLNAFAAMWRERVEEVRPLDLAERASLLGLTQPEAVILLMLGLTVWVFAALKGYSGFDDPYPEFGKRDRAARRISEDVEDAREALRDALEEPVAKARAQAESALLAQREAVHAMRAAYERTAERLLALASRSRRLGEAGAALVLLYRSENVAARRTPAPPAFTDPPGFPEPQDGALGRAAEFLSQAEQAHDQAQTMVAHGMGRLSEALHALALRLDGPA